jgi:SOS-response transcriptional repressor LexA
MKKTTKKQKEYKEKIKTKASKEQLAKFKDCFEKKCDNPNKDKMNKTIKNLSEQKPDEN